MGRRGGSGLRGGGPEASCSSLGWAISRNSIFYLVPMGRRGGSGLRGGGPEAGGCLVHFEELNFLPVPVGRREGSGLRGGGPETDDSSFGWAILKTLLNLLPGSHGEMGKSRIEGRQARSPVASPLGGPFRGTQFFTWFPWGAGEDQD
jgi:hypothetical protein